MRYQYQQMARKSQNLKLMRSEKIIETIEKDHELYTKAEISGKDSEDMSIEKFDLLKGKLRIQRFYNVPAKQFLNPNTVLDDITANYTRSYRDEVMKNIR
ncbi:DUF6731 family protein [Listeria fleischmannii]|uniref:Uncharacterized protein n=1 Tax=Listeria fleischmannii FSL S10-1203 TaxID=1265822 RepID=W7E2H4_9LIST|nr:DUF6731 family protein [Listeria fleischmannii]EUJ64838.1 hypothetical protein MCOL2_01545 [Listeria fleischmannii FSL S10-1203]